MLVLQLFAALLSLVSCSQLNFQQDVENNEVAGAVATVADDVHNVTAAAIEATEIGEPLAALTTDLEVNDSTTAFATGHDNNNVNQTINHSNLHYHSKESLRAFTRLLLDRVLGISQQLRENFQESERNMGAIGSEEDLIQNIGRAGRALNQARSQQQEVLEHIRAASAYARAMSFYASETPSDLVNEGSEIGLQRFAEAQAELDGNFQALSLLIDRIGTRLRNISQNNPPESNGA